MTVNVQPHPKAGAKQVVFSAPATNDSHTIVMGIMEDTKKTKIECASCAACTTRRAAAGAAANAAAAAAARSSMAQ